MAGRESEHLPYGRGLMLFRPGTPSAVRRRRLLFLVVFLVIGSAVVWPIYPRVSGPDPRVFGLPLFFAWVVGALTAMFVALLVLYRSDRGEP